MRITFVDSLFGRRTTERNAFDLIAKAWSDAAETWTAATPSTASYRIDAAGYTVRDWTTLTPSSSMTIPITSDDNAIVSDCSSLEPRQVTVRINAGSGQAQDVYHYTVVNLQGQT